MREDIENKFDTIALQMVERAERVRCDFIEFIEGLEVIKREVDTRLEMARSELKTGKNFD